MLVCYCLVIFDKTTITLVRYACWIEIVGQSLYSPNALFFGDSIDTRRVTFAFTSGHVIARTCIGSVVSCA